MMLFISYMQQWNIDLIYVYLDIDLIPEIPLIVKKKVIIW